MEKTSWTISANLILFLIFFVLKLDGIITWSWIWVTAPLWIPFAVGLTFIAFAIAIYLLYVLLYIIVAIIELF